MSSPRWIDKEDFWRAVRIMRPDMSRADFERMWEANWKLRLNR